MKREKNKSREWLLGFLIGYFTAKKYKGGYRSNMNLRSKENLMALYQQIKTGEINDL